MKDPRLYAVELQDEINVLSNNLSGRHVILRFIGGNNPQLDRIEFQWNSTSKPTYWQQGDKVNAMSWTRVPQALAILFLDYLGESNPVGPVYLSETNGGDLAKALGNAISDKGSKLHELFVERQPKSLPFSRVRQIFGGKNIHGKDEGERRICVQNETLPTDCIEVYWMSYGQERITDVGVFREIANRIRKDLGIPIGEAIPINVKEPVHLTTPPPSASPITSPAPPQIALQHPYFQQQPRIIKQEISFPRSLVQTLERIANAVDRPQQQSQPDDYQQPPTAKESARSLVNPFPPSPPPPPIPSYLFSISQMRDGLPDGTPLIYLDDENEDSCPWTARNAFEGVMILGATGSGKTTGSGATIAEAFLRSGFGGLVLTVKRDEADHWQRLATYCGRQNDLIVVRRGGQWKLNVLAYESQRPGQGRGFSENLVSFCRNLLSISSRHQGTGLDEKFWKEAGDQLLSATFDLFLLAGESITFDHLVEFISALPTNQTMTEEELLKIPIWSAIVEKAQNQLRTPEDQRLFSRAINYWVRVYSPLSSRTKTSITLGIHAMLDAFRGRDIPDLISTETNVTPECILSGKIVVLDLPLKEFGHTGLIIQSAWKYLFQTALERQGNSGDSRRRPVFLLEDEGQYFFSDHDHHFQDTARSSQVSHVILTQNLHNFYKEFGSGGTEAANSIFGNLNTKIFHANSDPTTNQWAANHFGTELKPRVSVNYSPSPPARDMWESLLRNFDPPRNSSVSTSQQREYAVQPEEFNDLRTGGPANDFKVDAYITWLGLSTNGRRHFTRITFQQNPNL